MRLSQQTKNAVRILVFLARNAERSPTVPEIAEACEITEFNTFKLVPLLARTGFVKTIRGRKGGVALAQSADDISVGAVVRATEGALQGVSADEGGAGGEEQAFDALVDDAFLAFVELLDRNSIAELAAGPPGGTGKKSTPKPVKRRQTSKVT